MEMDADSSPSSFSILGHVKEMAKDIAVPHKVDVFHGEKACK
jgi:hypothetical protein